MQEEVDRMPNTDSPVGLLSLEDAIDKLMVTGFTREEAARFIVTDSLETKNTILQTVRGRVKGEQNENRKSY